VEGLDVRQRDLEGVGLELQLGDVVVRQLSADSLDDSDRIDLMGQERVDPAEELLADELREVLEVKDRLGRVLDILERIVTVLEVIRVTARERAEVRLDGGIGFAEGAKRYVERQECEVAVTRTPVGEEESLLGEFFELWRLGGRGHGAMAPGVVSCVSLP